MRIFLKLFILTVTIALTSCSEHARYGELRAIDEGKDYNVIQIWAKYLKEKYHKIEPGEKEKVEIFQSIGGADTLKFIGDFRNRAHMLTKVDFSKLDEVSFVSAEDAFMDEDLFNAIFSLPNLKSITIRVDKALPKAMLNRPEVEFTRVIGNLNKIEEEFTKLNIKELILSSKWGKPFIPNIYKIKSLEVLKLVQYEMEDIPGDISNLSELRGLDLYGCGVQSVSPEIAGLSQLEYLKLSHCEFTELPDLRPLKSLKRLIIQAPITEFPQIIQKDSKLEVLMLGMAITAEENFWMDDEQKKMTRTVIPQNIGLLKELKWLELPGNGIKEIPESLCDCKYLHKLNLNNNQIKELPDCFKDFKELYFVKIAGNEIKDISPLFKLKCLYKNTFEFDFNDLEMKEAENTNKERFRDKMRKSYGVRINGVRYNPYYSILREDWIKYNFEKEKFHKIYRRHIRNMEFDFLYIKDELL